MKTSRILTIIVPCIVLMATACRPANEPAPRDNAESDETSAPTPSTQKLDAALAKVSEMEPDDDAGTTITSNGGTYRVTYVTDPDPIPLNHMFSIDVVIADKDGKPIADGDVQLVADAAMPAHGHGMNTKPSVEAEGNGRFHVRGMLFHMPGEWQIYFDIVHKGVAERAQADVVLE